MRKILTLAFTLLSIGLFAQVNERVALKANIQSSSGAGPTFTFYAIVSDDLSRWSASDVVVGDRLYVLEGSDCVELVIDSIIVTAGSILQARATEVTSILGGLPSGQAGIVSPFPNRIVPFGISGLRADLASCISQRISAIIDTISGGGATNLSFTGLTDTITLNSSNGTDVDIIAGNNITLTNVGGSMVITADDFGFIDTTRQRIYLPAHGFTLPTKGYIPINSEFDLAKASNIDSIQVGYIVGVPHPDTIEFITGGVITVPGHGLSIGALYYLNDDGTEDTSDNGSVSSVTAFPLDSNSISLREIGAITERYSPFRPLPSPILTVYGTNPLNPSDSIVGVIVNNVYKPLGLATAGTIFTTPYAGASQNTRYQNTDPMNQSYNPSNAWIYDGRSTVVRLKEKLLGLNLEDTLFSLQSLTPITCYTDSCAIEWFNTNYANGIRLPNGFIGYVIGSGTVNHPEHIWFYTDNHNSLFNDGVIRISGDETWLKPELEAGNVTINNGTNTLVLTAPEMFDEQKPAIQFQHNTLGDPAYYRAFELTDSTDRYALQYHDNEYHVVSTLPNKIITPRLETVVDSLVLRINSSTGTAGQVPMASGNGGTFWQNLPAGTIIDSLTTTADSIFLYTSAGVFSDALPATGSYTGFTPAADSGTGSNVASGGTLQVNGSGSIFTSVSDTIITIDNNRFGNYTYTEDSIIVDGTNFFGDGIAVYKGFLFSMSNGADSLYVFDIYNDYNVVSKFPVAGTSSPFIHAWNDKLTVTRSDSIRVYDIKDLNTPILLYKQLSGAINFPTQYNQFVFSSGGTNDIYIFNTETFQTDTVIVPRSNVLQASSLAYDDGYLYAVGVDASPDSIFIVNTNTKSYVNAYGQDGVGTTTYTYIFAQDKYLYALRSDTIDILNLADPENPVLVSKTKSFSGSGPFTRGLKVYGNYLIHCFSGGGFVVYDISDKTNVVALDTVYTTIASNTRGFDIYDNKIYLLSRNEPTIVVYDLPSIETGHLRSATIHTGKVRAENLISKEIEVQGLVASDLVVNQGVILSGYDGTKTAAVLGKTESGNILGIATDGTVIEIPKSSLTNTNLANTDLVNGSVYRTYTIPNTHTLDFIDQGGGNNFLARFSNRGFLTADKPTLLLQIRDSVSTNFSNLLLTPDSVDLFANKLTLKMPPLDATPTRLLTIDPSTRQVKYVLKDSIGGSGGPANLAYTGTADVIELDAGGTPVFIAEGSGVDVTQSGDTLTIAASGGGGTWLKPELESGNDVIISAIDYPALEIDNTRLILLQSNTESLDRSRIKLESEEEISTLAFSAVNDSTNNSVFFDAESTYEYGYFYFGAQFADTIISGIEGQSRVDENIITVYTDTLDLTNVGNIKGLPTTDLAYTGTADVIELDAGGTSVFIAEGSGVDVTQSGDTLTITGKGTRFVQDSITGATLTIDLNEAPTAVISLKMTSATSVTLTINNPYGFLTDATAPTYEGETGVYTFRFWGISGTDNVTWPANFYDMNGTALGTDALTAGTAYTCYYDPLSNEYYCK